MSERRTTGSRALAGREAKGLSLRRAARRLGVSPRMLRSWEQGRFDIPVAVREAMVTLYGLPREQLVPDRPVGVTRDGTNGTVRIGSVAFSVHGSDDASLREFLSALRRERGLAPGARLAVRAGDVDLLAEVLGGSADRIVRNLQRLLGVDEPEAVEFGRWMFRRTALAGALTVGLVTGVAATGALAASPPVASATETGTAGSSRPVDAAAADGVGAIRRDAEPNGADQNGADQNGADQNRADPNWAEIGDAAVLWRDDVSGGVGS